MTRPVIQRFVCAGQSTFDFTGMDDSVYDGYDVMFCNVVPTELIDFRCRVSQDGGSNWDDGANSYHMSNRGMSGGSEIRNETFRTYFEIGVAISSVAGRSGLSGFFKIFRPHLVARTMMLFEGGWHSSSVGINTVGGYRDADVAINGLRFYFGSGTLESGIILVMGITKPPG